MGVPTAQDVVTVVNRLTDEVKRIVEMDTKWWDKVEKIAELVVPETEILGYDWAGVDKKSFALSVIEGIWLKNFNIKYLPDIFEKRLVQFVADKVIEALVALYNKTGKFVHRTK